MKIGASDVTNPNRKLIVDHPVISASTDNVNPKMVSLYYNTEVFSKLNMLWINKMRTRHTEFSIDDDSRDSIDVVRLMIILNQINWVKKIKTEGILRWTRKK